MGIIASCYLISFIFSSIVFSAKNCNYKYFKVYEDHPPEYENAMLPSAPPAVQGSTSGYPIQPQSFQQMPAHHHQQPPPPPPPPGRSVVYVIPSNLRDQPTQLVCPQCKASILTQLRYESGVAALVFFFSSFFYSF